MYMRDEKTCDTNKCHKGVGVLGWICFVLVVIGGINWGLIGAFSFNLVASLVGDWPAIERIVYILVGVAAIILIIVAIKCCCCRRKCTTSTTTCTHTHNINNPNDKIPPQI